MPKEKSVSITLTQRQWSDLHFYLLASTKYRESERDAWAKLAQEKLTDGTPRHKNAAGNSQFWTDMIASLEVIQRQIDV